MEISPDKQRLAAASYQHIRLYDLTTNNPNGVLNFEGIQKNVTDIGFQEDGKWMYSGGEDGKCRIWDLRSRGMQGPQPFDAHAPITSISLHPNQVELFIGDQNGVIHRWDLKTNLREQLVRLKTFR